MTNPTTPHRLTKAELDALPLYAAVLCVDQKYQRVYLALKVGTPQRSGGHTWRTTDYTTIPDSGRLAGHYAVLLDPGLTALVLMGFVQDAALAAASVKAGDLTGADQVSDVVHARHAPDVVHSRHDAPRDIPSSPSGPAMAPSLARADEAGAESRALRDIAAERESHAERGFNVAHDDMHNVHDLTQLAQRYVNLSGSGQYPDAAPGYISRTALVKAGSLLVAAIDRLDRANAEDDRG
ncbi:hypothetical protein ACFWE5_03805 [Cellulosimicrobium funkei]|uniref:hypothetical protein n=1 Tax=Cellulosimicrobium funkei TaxID=264251 RepID=UPI003659E534